MNYTVDGVPFSVKNHQISKAINETFFIPIEQCAEVKGELIDILKQTQSDQVFYNKDAFYLLIGNYLVDISEAVGKFLGTGGHFYHMKIVLSDAVMKQGAMLIIYDLKETILSLDTIR